MHDKLQDKRSKERTYLFHFIKHYCAAKQILTFLTFGDASIIPDDGNHGLTQILHQYLMFCQSELW